MATTSEMQGDNTWAWPCPYCGESNALEAVSCAHCGVQLRDPDEDELFSTFGTENAQVVDPSVPRFRESLWSTDASNADAGVVDAETVESTPPRVHIGPSTSPDQGPIPSHGHGTGAGSTPGEPGLFSATAPRPAPEPPSGAGGVFGSQARRQPEPPMPPVDADSRNLFAAGQRGDNFAHGAYEPPRAAPPQAPRAGWPGQEPFMAAPPQVDHTAADPFGHSGAMRATPDPHGLSVAVESLPPADRERCAVPIGVCGALLNDQEVVFGAVTGHLLGHPAVILLTNLRVIVANARRWEPLVDVFHPGPDLVVHTRHDRDVAAITFVQGQALTSIDDITDVAGALDLAERIRAVAGRS